MAFLLLDNLTQNNGRLLQSSVKILELLLLSAGLISSFVMVKKAVASYSCEIVFSSLVGFWSSIRCFLSSSLSVCIIIQVMVVLIAASSTFYRLENDKQDEITVNADDHDMKIAESFVVSPPAPSSTRDVFEVTPPPPSPRNVNEESAATLSSRTRISVRSITSSTLRQGSNDDVSSHVRSNSTEQNCVEKTTLSSLGESFFDEALMSAAHEIKKTAYSFNSSPKSSEPTKGKVKGTNLLPIHGKRKEEFIENDDKLTSTLSEDKENEEEDTMEATWKAITGGGKQKSKNKHLKKSETWDMPQRRSAEVRRLDSDELVLTTPKWRELRKAETFNDAVSLMRRGGLRRDPSISLEEFNQRAEAFIMRIYDKMRIERQESNQRFLNMIKGGV